MHTALISQGQLTRDFANVMAECLSLQSYIPTRVEVPDSARLSVLPGQTLVDQGSGTRNRTETEESLWHHKAN